jgi:glutamyl-tRNA synthetase
MNPPVIGRLAPSPTGGLHLGHARTFLIAWLAARSAGGRMILRIEDIDASRIRSGATEAAIEDLRWLGLDWDEGPDVGGPHTPYVQSQRRDRYDVALDVLKARELVYPCTCTRAEIARAASAPHQGDEGPRYPGTCAARTAKDAEALAGRTFCWRFRTAPGLVGWRDLIRGELDLDPSGIGGDFLVGRSSGEPAYQLAVVCDDAAMGVTQVIRGDDLVTSTPRQILLYYVLGLALPQFGHVPLVLGRDGKRLAKRDDAIKLATLREAGIDRGWIVAKLGASIGIVGSIGSATPSNLVGRFDLGRIPSAPWVEEIS